jgi:hypothetical protein
MFDEDDYQQGRKDNDYVFIGETQRKRKKDKSEKEEEAKIWRIDDFQY